MILQITSPLTAGSAALIGLILLAGVVAATAAAIYRWYTGDRVQEGLAVLVGLAVVAIYLNTTTAIGQVIGGRAGLFNLETAIINVITFAVAAGGSYVGRRLGDRIAVETSIVTGRRVLETDVSRLVRSVGRVVTVTLPDEIEDIEGYDSVEPEVKESLSGKTLVFPSRLTVAELKDRLRTRLSDDYGVGHIDVEMADDGTVEYLAVGSRTIGLGPTLPPGTVAIAVRADPGFAASAGDVVELWRTEPELDRLTVGEIRGIAGDIVTLALDEAEARDLPASDEFRLVSRPASAGSDREFAGVLRAADETLGAVTVDPDSELDGVPIEETGVTVVALKPTDGPLQAVPPVSRPCVSGDILYTIGRPEELRRLESKAGSPKPAAEPG